MSKVLVTESYLDDIADAIREKTGSEDTYTPGQMAGAIEDIQTADEVVLVSKSVTANGTYNPASDSADGYSGVTVNVPNTYTAADEGKVVSSGNLVSQSSKSITQNGTHDTTINNSVSVDVPNTYTVSDNGKVVVNQALIAQTSKSINSNGTYDTTANNSVVVDVPNSYAASDEGKVVSNGALVTQTSVTKTENGTYDTTLYNEVVVNVSGGMGTSVPSQLQGLSYGYIGFSGSGTINPRFFTSPDYVTRLDIFEVTANHRYIIIIPANEHKNRNRVQFYSGKSYSDFETYIENPETSGNNRQIYGGTNLPGAENETDANSKVFAFKPSTNGAVLVATNNQAYTDTYAECYDLDAE